MSNQRSMSAEYWTSPAIRHLPCHVKCFGAWCFTGPQSNFMGLFRLNVEDAKAEVSISDAEVAEAVAALSEPQPHDGEAFLEYEVATRLLWIVKRLEHEFPKAQMSDAQAKYCQTQLRKLPTSALVLRFCARYKDYEQVDKRKPRPDGDSRNKVYVFRSELQRLSRLQRGNQLITEETLRVTLTQTVTPTVPPTLTGTVPPTVTPTVSDTVTPTVRVTPRIPLPASGSPLSALCSQEQGEACQDGNGEPIRTDPWENLESDPAVRVRAERLLVSIEELAESRPGKGRFNVRTWIDRFRTEGVPPAEALRVLEGLKERWESIRFPDHWLEKAMECVRRGVDIAEAVEEHERVVRLPANVSLLRDVFRAAGGSP